MFYHNWLASELVFCVAGNREYFNMRSFLRLEYEPTFYAIQDKTFFSATQKKREPL